MKHFKDDLTSAGSLFLLTTVIHCVLVGVITLVLLVLSLALPEFTYREALTFSNYIAYMVVLLFMLEISIQDYKGHKNLRQALESWLVWFSFETLLMSVIQQGGQYL